MNVDLNIKTIKIINSIIVYMKDSGADLDDIETISDLLAGELEENHPDIIISKPDIKKYLQIILKGEGCKHA